MPGSIKKNHPSHNIEGRLFGNKSFLDFFGIIVDTSFTGDSDLLVSAAFDSALSGRSPDRAFINLTGY